MDRLLDAGAEALERLGGQLRAGAVGLRREDQEQQQQQQQGGQSQQQEQQEQQVVAADGSTSSELYGPEGLNATAPDISSRPGRDTSTPATATTTAATARQGEGEGQPGRQQPPTVPASDSAGAAAAAAEAAAAEEARPVEGFSPELQATLAEAKGRIDAENEMLKERFGMRPSTSGR